MDKVQLEERKRIQEVGKKDGEIKETAGGIRHAIR
jgi:hypothetical protein